jgi:transposase
VFEDTASALFGVEGLQVTDVQTGPGGALEVRAVTDYPAASACPDCGIVSGKVHEMVLARPRDVRRAGDVVDLRWVKVRRKCSNQECPRKTFTEWVPQLPPRCRITARLPEQAAHEVTGRRSRRRRRPGTPGSPGQWCTRSSRRGLTRYWSRPQPRWRTWHR